MKFYDDEHTDWADVIFWVLVIGSISTFIYGLIYYIHNLLKNFN